MKIKKQIIIYGGRFQPFHLGHYNVYKYLCKEFGKDNVVIATSNKVKYPDSPFNFDNKKEIITTMFKDIPKSHIIQEITPYVPKNTFKKFANEISEDTIAIFALGEKDGNRLTKGKYFKPYNKSDVDNMEGFETHGYVYSVPMQAKINNKYISGSEIRAYFKNPEYSEFQKQNFFTLIYNDFNKKIYNLMISKLQNVKENFKNPYLNNDRALLNEGGSAGHMLHPWENNELTFSELKWIIITSLEGKLETKEYKPQLKSDGQNLLITVKNHQILASRNKTDRKHFAENGMTINDVKQKFSGRGAITTAFVNAMTSIEDRLLKLPSKVTNSIFENGKKFLNIEIIYPDTKNVIDYAGLSGVIFHNIVEFDYDGNQINTETKMSKYLTKILKHIQSDIIDDMPVLEIKPAEIKKINNSDTYANELIGLLNKTMQMNNVTDSNSILDYKKEYFKINVLPYFDTNNKQINELLLNRWCNNDKKISISKIYKMILLNNPTGVGENIVTKIKYFEKNDLQSVQYNSIKTLRFIFLKLGVYVLQNLKSYITINPSKTTQLLKQEVTQTIDKIKNMTDLDKKTADKISIAIKSIYDLGGINNISPEEGIVFKYKGKLYKLSGLFADVNKLLGVFKYRK